MSILLAAICLTATAQDWDHWRGPNRNGITSEASGWAGESWELRETLWSVNVGEGSTSPLIIDGRVYCCGWSNNRDRLVCLDATTGDELWHQAYPAPRYGRHAVGDQRLYAAITATPEYDADTKYLFTLSLDGDLKCWDTQDKGRPVWGRNLYQEYKAERRPEVAKRRKTRRDYGYTTAPLVHGDWVIVEVGSTKHGNLVAFEKKTGRPVWTSESRDEAGHTGGPVPLTVAGIPCVAVLTLRNLVVTRLDGTNAGRTVASHPWTTDFGNNIATPAVFGNSIIVTSAYNHMAMTRLDITLDSVQQVWEVRRASGVCSPVIHKGHVYWAWNGVHCLDFATGKDVWKGGRVAAPGSCIITGDDRMIVWANRGDLILVETAARSPSKYTELAKRPGLFSKDAWSHAALCDGLLLCKDRAGNLKCFHVPQ